MNEYLKYATALSKNEEVNPVTPEPVGTDCQALCNCAKASGCDVTPRDAFELLYLLGTVMSQYEYSKVISEVFPASNPEQLKEVQIPRVYSVPKEVSESYKKMGIKLVPKTSLQR